MLVKIFYSILITSLLISCSTKTDRVLSQQEEQIDSLTNLVLEIANNYDLATSKLDSLLAFSDSLSYANDSLHELSESNLISYRALVELSTSPPISLDSRDEDGFYRYINRAEVYLSEIYRSLYITRIGYYGEGQQRVVSKLKVDLENLLDINTERTSGLKFDSWVSPTQFRIYLHDEIYAFNVIDGSIELEK